MEKERLIMILIILPTTIAPCAQPILNLSLTFFSNVKLPNIYGIGLGEPGRTPATGAAPPVNLTFVISGGAFRVSKSHSQNLLNPILKLFHRAIIHSLWIARCDLHHGKLVSLAGVLTAMSLLL